MKNIKGSCLCGAVEFYVRDNFQYAGYCHCTQCTKFSGTIAVGGILCSDFSLTKGADDIIKFKRSESTTACFCGVCGTNMYGEKQGTEFIHIRYGNLNDTPQLLPQAHMFVGSKADWYEINDSLPQFEGFPIS